MKTWTTAHATTESHTVQTDRGLVAGSLVRSLGSRRILGYIWQAGSVWRWRSAGGAAFGERATERGAIEVLRDVADTQSPRLPVMPVATHRRTEQVYIPLRLRPESAPTPTEQKRAHIVWDDDAQAVDLMATIATTFTRYQR